MSNAATPARRCTVRAYPAQGSTHRWRAGRAWGRDPVVCEIVDLPEFVEVPGPPDAVGISRPVKRPHPTRITPADFSALKSDPLISVVIEGDSSSEAAEMAKADAAKLADKVRELESALAGASEEAAERERSARDEIAKIAAEKAALEVELANMRSKARK